MHNQPNPIHSLYLAGHESSTGLLDLRTKTLAWVNPSAHAKKARQLAIYVYVYYCCCCCWLVGWLVGWLYSKTKTLTLYLTYDDV